MLKWPEILTNDEVWFRTNNNYNDKELYLALTLSQPLLMS